MNSVFNVLAQKVKEYEEARQEWPDIAPVEVLPACEHRPEFRKVDSHGVRYCRACGAEFGGDGET